MKSEFTIRANSGSTGTRALWTSFRPWRTRAVDRRRLRRFLSVCWTHIARSRVDDRQCRGHWPKKKRDTDHKLLQRTHMTPTPKDVDSFAGWSDANVLQVLCGCSPSPRLGFGVLSGQVANLWWTQHQNNAKQSARRHSCTVTEIHRRTRHTPRDTNIKGSWQLLVLIQRQRCPGLVRYAPSSQVGFSVHPGQMTNGGMFLDTFLPCIASLSCSLYLVLQGQREFPECAHVCWRMRWNTRHARFANVFSEPPVHRTWSQNIRFHFRVTEHSTASFRTQEQCFDIFGRISKQFFFTLEL